MDVFYKNILPTRFLPQTIHQFSEPFFDLLDRVCTVFVKAYPPAGLIFEIGFGFDTFAAKIVRF